MSNYKFIVNPTSSRGKGKSVGNWLEDECLRRKLNFELTYTEKPGDAKDIAAESIGKFEKIVAVGGDGTLQEVINGSLDKTVIHGIIPVGTGNDFVRAAKIPIDPTKALDLLIDGKTHLIDVGKINNLIFHNGVGIGFDAIVVDESLKIKKLRGQAVYLLAIFKALKNYKAPLIQLSYNNNSTTDKYLLITVGNGISLGGGIKLTPYASIYDGLLDLNIIEDVNKLKIIQNLLKAYSGNHVHMPQVTTDKSKEILIQSEEGFAVHADGELIGLKLNEVEIKIIPKAIKFVVPKTNN